MNRHHPIGGPDRGGRRGWVRITALTIVFVVSGLLALAGTTVIGGSGPIPISGIGASPAAAQAATTVPDDITTGSTTPVLEKPQSIPQPNSGKKPEQPGDRGGWMQLTVLALVVLGLGTVFARIAVSARKQNRRNAAAPR